ncbi:toxin YdaT family protein [Cronobacter turicensis]|uniref:toxin YdaT family protein n=1 Tax=Cronobacter turicensis TaxID=413502 RepID=UPI0024C20D28|nr:toxin YdaT family protein [Cronobacter turicensis]MDK1208288.1 toxin YdaT family protein [Cronobacter turicensis]MDK1236503.1 toxin YdaT family protein [Cronobacter turicensis]
MKIMHKHICDALNTWAMAAGARKIPAAEIAKAYFQLGLTSPHLYGDEHPEALSRNTQKIFRWANRDTDDARESIQALYPAIKAAMPPMLLARLRSHDSPTIRELVTRKQRIDDEFETLFGVMMTVIDSANNGGPAGCSLVH